MMRYSKHYYFVFIILLTISGCSSFRSKKVFKEGTIEYAIQSEDQAKPGFNSHLVPNKIIVKFRDSNTSNTIEGLSGAVTLTYINNFEDQICIILVKLLNKKMYFEEPLVKSSLPSTYSGMPQLIIKKTDEIVNFQGYKCNKAIASFNDSTKYSFDILYTNEIKITNPNANTPFDSIDGVMLKFKVKLYRHLLSISATNIKQEDISMDNFTTPADYDKVPKRTIEDFISLLQ
jgi:hypothetical protein